MQLFSIDIGFDTNNDLMFTAMCACVRVCASVSLCPFLFLSSSLSG